MVSKLPLRTPSTCSNSRQFLRMGLHQSWSATRLYTWHSIVLLYINDIVKILDPISVYLLMILVSSS